MNVFDLLISKQRCDFRNSCYFSSWKLLHLYVGITQHLQSQTYTLVRRNNTAQAVPDASVVRRITLFHLYTPVNLCEFFLKEIYAHCTTYLFSWLLHRSRCLLQIVGEANDVDPLSIVGEANDVDPLGIMGEANDVAHLVLCGKRTM